MQRKLLGIINVDFDVTGQMVIVYSAFVNYLRKNGNKMNSVAAKIVYDSVRFYIILSMSLVSLLKSYG
jgi:hypothetical protein